MSGQQPEERKYRGQGVQAPPPHILGPPHIVEHPFFQELCLCRQHKMPSSNLASSLYSRVKDRQLIALRPVRLGIPEKL